MYERELQISSFYMSMQNHTHMAYSYQEMMRTSVQAI